MGTPSYLLAVFAATARSVMASTCSALGSAAAVGSQMAQTEVMHVACDIHVYTNCVDIATGESEECIVNIGDTKRSEAIA